jgi:hypothetical protein
MPIIIRNSVYVTFLTLFYDSCYKFSSVSVHTSLTTPFKCSSSCQYMWLILLLILISHWTTCKYLTPALFYSMFISILFICSCGTILLTGLHHHCQYVKFSWEYIFPLSLFYMFRQLLLLQILNFLMADWISVYPAAKCGLALIIEKPCPYLSTLMKKLHIKL